MIETEYYGPQTPQQNRIVGDFVSNLVWKQPGMLEKYCTMGVFDDGELIAGTVYHNWHPDEGIIELSSA